MARIGIDLASAKEPFGFHSSNELPRMELEDYVDGSAAEPRGCTTPRIYLGELS
jgi:hypothetical protein